MRRRTMFGAATALAALVVTTVSGPAWAGPAPRAAAPAANPATQSVAPAVTPPDIDVSAVQADLSQLYTIAMNNGGNRHAGTAGHSQSVAFIKQKLQAVGYTVTEQYCSGCSYPSNNLIADWPGGDTSQTIMFGSHLDSVSAGPGINDNGSGSMSILEVALALAHANPTMSKHVRFGWWTGEEQGMQGSAFYTASLNSSQRANIAAYYNFDMIASPNAGYFINEINSTQSAPLKAYWDSLNLQPENDYEGVGRSDDSSFSRYGILTSAYATGADATKTSAQAAKWGGSAYSPFDSCYHSSCDTTSNINATALNRCVDGIAYTLWTLAVSSAPSSDFSVSVNPSSGSAQAGSSVTATVSTTTTSGSAQSVALSASGLPSGASASFSPSSVTSGGSSTLTVSTSSSTPAGSYPITITGSGNATHSVTYTLTVNGTPPTNDFSVSVNPSSASVQAGSSATFTVQTSTTSGSAQTLALSASGLPSGASASFNPSSVTSGGSSTLTLSTSSSTPAGSYSITITAAGNTTHSVTLTLTVTSSSPGGCGGIAAWSATTSYAPGDVVSHNGHKWNSTWWSTNAEPGAPGSWAVWTDQGAC